MKRGLKTTLWLIIGIFILGILSFAWILYGGISNPGNRKTIGGIRPPVGYERVEVDNDSFGAFIRAFPLKKRGSHMYYYDGQLALMQYWGYAVLDLPMLSNNEQCADAVMRIYSEYLWNKRKPNDVHFLNYSGKDERYTGSKEDRKAFEKYLRHIFDVSNTGTIRKQLKKKAWKDIAPGDVLVYPAANNHSSGHAVLVADVAVNARTGKKAIMLAQSSTPALTMHIIRDFLHPAKSPWLIIDDKTSDIFISGISFNAEDLRTW